MVLFVNIYRRVSQTLSELYLRFLKLEFFQAFSVYFFLIWLYKTAALKYIWYHRTEYTHTLPVIEQI